MTRNRLKVLWLSHLIPYPPKGGALIRSYHLIKELSKYHDVDLLAFDQKAIFSSYYPSHQSGLADAEKILSHFLRSYEFFKIPMETERLGKHRTALKGLFSESPYTMRWLNSDEFKSALISKLKKNRYDAIHCDTISLTTHLANLEIPSNTATILNHHNIESNMMLRRAHKERNPIKKIYFLQESIKIRSYENDLTPKYSLNIVCSNEDKEILQKSSSLSPGRVAVVPNGVTSPSNIVRNPDSLNPKLLFVGGLNWYPNRDAVHHFFDEIWPDLRNKVPNLTIDIVGKRPSKKLLSLSAMDNRVKVHGFVNDINQFYQKASIYICPIRDGGGTKLKVLDALAHGLPMVAYPAACEGIDIKNGEHALITNSAQEFATEIIKLLGAPDQLERLSINGPILIKEKYTVEKIGENYANVIEGLRLRSTRN